MISFAESKQLLCAQLIIPEDAMTFLALVLLLIQSGSAHFKGNEWLSIGS